MPGGRLVGAERLAEGEESLEIDDSLSPLERLQKYLTSSLIIHRLHVVRELAETARWLGYEAALARCVPVLDQLQLEPEPVLRQALAEQLPALAAFFLAADPAAYDRVLLASVLPVAAHLIVDQNPQVRQSAAEALVAVAPLVHESEREARLLAVAQTLADDVADEEHRVEACQLFHALAPALGPLLVRRFLSSHLPRLARDSSSFRVRKVLISFPRDLFFFFFWHFLAEPGRRRWRPT